MTTNYHTTTLVPRLFIGPGYEASTIPTTTLAIYTSLVSRSHLELFLIFLIRVLARDYHTEIVEVGCYGNRVRHYNLLNSCKAFS